MAELIRLETVYKSYQMGEIEVPALQGVTLSISAGEFVAIMGASGSGKTTLMNIIGCLDRPTSGGYCLDGMRVDQLGKGQLALLRNRRLGFVFQSFNLLPRSTALENAELPLLYHQHQLPAGERRRQALDALHRVGLQGREGHFPNQLSGGQQQRVAIARALVNQPMVLLADEPTGNLDSLTSVDMMQIFQQLNSEGGLTAILVTHEPDIAHYARRNITFRDGRIIRDEEVREPKCAEWERHGLLEEHRQEGIQA